jgi:tRNA (cmo5U34)-methyltransferase
MGALNRFDRIAGSYDLLVRLVFGKRLHQAQQHFLNQIRPSDRVLILGGGTGALLLDLIRINPTCSVWYIDASSSMIAIAKEKMHEFPQSRIHFIHGTENDIHDMQFDVVITNFFLDLFCEQTLSDVILKINRSLKSKGKWFVSDFVSHGLWHKAMLKVMYFFFRLTCGLETAGLPPWERILQAHGLSELQHSFYCNDFVKSTVFQKVSSG